MISGIFHSGSGLGNQLHRYVATRVLAKDKGYEFSMVAPENFKGKSFMNLDMGLSNPLPYITEMPEGKVCAVEWFGNKEAIKLDVWEEKTNYYNPEFNFIEDNTIIDGEFQDERYFGHRLNEVDEWLNAEALKISNRKCIIGFRGGEFALFPELFLTKEYWNEAINLMKKKCHYLEFEVHTDDVELAQQFFPGYECIHDIGLNWRSVRNARYAIIANSSFYILPRLLKHHGDVEAVTIAPRFWARRNTKEWSMPQNFYKKFTHI